jgi:hypothetical protein
MAHTIQVVTTIKINGSQVTSLSRSIEVEATDSITINVRGTADASGPDTDKEVELQPTSTSGQVTFIGITADRYDANLKYKVNAIGNPEVPLDQPQVLLGEGAVGLLDNTEAPTSLFFSSNIAENAEIQILVGRDATPP